MPSISENPEFLDLEQLSEATGLSVRALGDLLRADKFMGAVIVGNSWSIPRAGIEIFRRERELEAAESARAKAEEQLAKLELAIAESKAPAVVWIAHESALKAHADAEAVRAVTDPDAPRAEPPRPPDVKDPRPVLPAMIRKANQIGGPEKTPLRIPAHAGFRMSPGDVRDPADPTHILRPQGRDRSKGQLPALEARVSQARAKLAAAIADYHTARATAGILSIASLLRDAAVWRSTAQVRAEEASAAALSGNVRPEEGFARAPGPVAFTLATNGEIHIVIAAAPGATP